MTLFGKAPDDAFLRGVEEACRRRFPDAVLARERMEIDF